MFNIVLVHPEIPNNTGSVGRLCVGSNSHLHLIKPLGFEISDKRVKRAGLDYWPDLNLTIHESFDDLLKHISDANRMFLFSSKSTKSYTDVTYQNGDWLIFGKESSGLPENILLAHTENQVTIPFPGKIRSFNLSNAVAMAIGEGMRQIRIS